VAIGFDDLVPVVRLSLAGPGCSKRG